MLLVTFTSLITLQSQSSAFKCLVYLKLCFRFGGARKKEESADGEGEDEVDKDKPDYGLSGKLTAETNTYRVC